MTPLEHLGQRAQRDPFFLGCPLYWFARSESLTDDGLAEYLGCTRETLVKVRLCATPKARPPALTRDLAAIVERFGVNQEALAKAVRRGSAILQAQTAANLGMAARDRKKE
jgi:hypothetical protein